MEHLIGGIHLGSIIRCYCYPLVLELPFPPAVSQNPLHPSPVVTNLDSVDAAQDACEVLGGNDGESVVMELEDDSEATVSGTEDERDLPPVRYLS